jgi:lipopolysaccharide export LptBFGC system permease protein LptF
MEPTRIWLFLGGGMAFIAVMMIMLAALSYAMESYNRLMFALFGGGLLIMSGYILYGFGSQLHSQGLITSVLVVSIIAGAAVGSLVGMRRKPIE